MLNIEATLQTVDLEQKKEILSKTKKKINFLFQTFLIFYM